MKKITGNIFANIYYDGLKKSLELFGKKRLR